MKRKKGFTLVELLVVIAIIALLMGILMPALARVRRAARSSACMVQMKQWATVYSMYTGDWDGYFCPDYYPENYKNGGRFDWWHVLKTYYKDINTLCCPTATKIKSMAYPSKDEGGKVPFCAHYDSRNGGYKASYAYNGWLGVAVYEQRAIDLKRYPEWRWATVNRIKQPNRVPVIGDSVGHLRKFARSTTTPEDVPDVQIGDAECDATSHVDRIIEFCIRRHGPPANPNINMGFADFSVRPVGLKALWSLSWHRMDIANRKVSPNADMTNIWPEWMKGYSEDGVINYK